MDCPVCDSELRPTDRSGIEVDYCPRCRGVWLDRGELEKLIERERQHSAESYRPPQAVPSPYPGESHPEKYYEKKKKKSFLGDLLDFD